MNHRSSTAALLLVVAVMLTVCLVAMLRLPAKQVEVAGTREITYRIDPNAADLDTLCLLPRIGRGIAQRIITDRDANGPFRSAADMARVPMIGSKTVEALRPWIDIQRPVDPSSSWP